MDSRSQLGMAAMNPMLLQHALRGLCSNGSQWVYAVLWRILPRNYPPPQFAPDNLHLGDVVIRWETETDITDRSKGNKRNWILVWEDGYCDFAACSGTGLSSSSFLSVRQRKSSDNQQLEAMNPELFFKMSHEVYNYGEGLIGKVAADNSHKWVYQEPLDDEIGFFSPRHGNNIIDPHPRTWEGQFKSGIQTIAVVAVQDGVLQLGSTTKIEEDLNFVLYTQHKFNFLHSVPGVFVPQHSGASNGGNEPPPSNRVSTTANYNNQFRVAGGAPEPWPPVVTLIAGKKRSLESSVPGNSNLSGGYGFDLGTHEGISPFPPKAVHTGIQRNPHALMPSMSSLQALLSKFPSVDANDGCSYPSSGSFEVNNSGGFNDFNSNQLPGMTSDGSDLHRMVEGEGMVIGPSNAGNYVCEDVEVQPCTYRNVVAKEKHRYNSMFDALDSFTEFGIQDALENGDFGYSSFLNTQLS